MRLLALCTEEELTVGELASLIGESQPQVTKKTQPLREAGLLTARRDGTARCCAAHVGPDVVLGAALEEGRLLCIRDGSLARVAAVVAQREDVSRRIFEQSAVGAKAEALAEAAPADRELLGWLAILAPLLTPAAHAPASSAAAAAAGVAYAGTDRAGAVPTLAVDVGTGEGALLPLLSPLFERVVAVDRSPARLRAAARGSPSGGCRTCGSARAASTIRRWSRRSRSAAAPTWSCSRACCATRRGRRTWSPRRRACSAPGAT